MSLEMKLRMRTVSVGAGVALCFVLGVPAILEGAGEVGEVSEIDFDRDVRPILSDACYPCHRPDAKVRQAELRLDTKEGAFRLRDGRAVIVPGKSGESELARRVRTTDPADVMPPPKANRVLSPREKKLLVGWIDRGTPWKEHWAFRRPERPPLPSVRDAAWPRNAIDRFVLARLDKEGLTPSRQAAPETLVRRLTLDFTGLPPSPDEVEAFIADTAPGHVALARLGGQRPQHQHAIRPVHGRADRRGPAPGGDLRAAARHRLQP